VVQFDRSAFIAKFREEADDHLQKLNEGIITLEVEPDNVELVNELLRSAHTLKGSSNMVGLVDISEVAHRMEDIMVLVRDGKLRFSADLSEPFFDALDAIVYMADKAVAGEKGEYDLPDLLDKLGAIADAAGGGEAVAKAGAQGAAKTAKKAQAEQAAAAEEAAQAEEAPDEGAAAAEEREEPGEEEEDEEQAGPAEGPDVEKAAKAGPKPSTTTIRVRTEQVDRILNLVGEMVIAQIKAEDRVLSARHLSGLVVEIMDQWMLLKGDMAARLGGHLPEAQAIDELLHRLRDGTRDYVGEYGEDTARMSAVVTDLQEAGMQIRMLPVATVFNAFPRAVHDLARAFKKEIKLEIEGAETELDKKILEEINDPLVHIVRNAVDHGIEPADDREKAGKPRQGTLRLAAAQEGDQIQIVVQDDGAGIDPAKVRESAIRKGFLTEAEARALSDQEAMYLIFETGFSTSQIITEISGRGVGLDVVRQFVSEKLKGSFDVDSEVGKGTTMVLTLPLTLAIIRALLVGCGGLRFALPTTAVEETHKVDPETIKKAEGREAMWLRGRSVPLVRLDTLLGLARAEPDEEKTSRDLSVVIVASQGQRMGFIVDELMGEQQIVIKTLGTHLKQVENVAGATILGAGEVVLILHVPDLVAGARSLTGLRAPGQKGAEAKEGGPRRILIAEDSFTTRELERSIFEASGYLVDTAMDGAEALAKLKESAFDLVVTDVQMPNMDGFELTRNIKQDPALARTPVVIVTSLEREEEKREGIEAGADAYITKSVFNQDTLLDTVERLTG
jgi:chemotaxis protein histidine kinase CheA/ActR/RegA family two-component response regulator